MILHAHVTCDLRHLRKHINNLEHCRDTARLSSCMTDFSSPAGSMRDEKRGLDGSNLEKQKRDVHYDDDEKGDGEEISDLERKLRELDPEEAEPLRRQIQYDEVSANLFTIVKPTNAFDKFVLCLGIFFAIVHGVALPCLTFVVKAIINKFTTETQGDPPNFMSDIGHLAKYFVYIGVGIIGSSAIESYLLEDRGELISGRWRKNFLSAVISQNIAFFDRLGSGQITTSITNDTTSIQEAFHHTATVVQGLSTFVAAIVISLILQWKIALILLSAVFVNFCAMAIGGGTMGKFQAASESAFQQGSTIAEEAFSAIRTTVAFNSQEVLTKKFDRALVVAAGHSYHAGIALSGMLAVIWAVVMFTYSLGFWEGSRILGWSLESDSTNTNVIGSIFGVILAMLIGSFQLGNIAPSIRFIVKGISAVKSLARVINRRPVVDSQDDNGEIISPELVKGHIVLTNIRFRYPSRPEALILPDFSLDIPAGKMVALVGASGGGKSTIVGLLERFYTPIRGEILIDGVSIDKLNLRWLRQQIGYVQQEPTLFADTIFENVAYGLIGSPWENAAEEDKREKVIAACKNANAYDFIQTLTDGFETNVGDRGFLLSGGQKQRICIARAIVSDPPILLLDEATSALDTKSEGIVQEALDRASHNRTTIVIAHRLSTVKNADKIVVLSSGQIVEQGTHSELLSHNGTYSQLVAAQQVTKLKRKNDYGEEEDDDGSDSGDEGQGLIVQEDAIASADAGNRESFIIASSPEKGKLGSENVPGIKDPVDGYFLKYMGLLWSLNRNERIYICIGIFAAFIMGYSFPSLAMITGFIVQGLMTDITKSISMMRHNVNVLTGWLFFLGCIMFIACAVMTFVLSLASDRLVRNIRLELFKQILRLDIAFFDYPGNTPGALTSVLAKESKAIEGMGGATMGQILQSVVILVSGIATGIPWNWRIGLVATATTPILLACGFLRVWIITKLGEHARKVYEGSGSLASSYVSAIRTVQSLTRERGVVRQYSSVIDAQVKRSRTELMLSAIMYGLSQGLTQWVDALVFWWGSKVMHNHQATVKTNLIAFLSIILGGQSAGQIFSYSPDLTKAFKAAQNIYRILTAQPWIDSWSKGGIMVDDSIEGDLEFRKVYFRYPTRPEVPVLRGVNLKARPGQYIALVGPSGCGKSTSVGLIERFYDVLGGNVLIDGKDIREYNLKSLRSHMALVQQEPMLYSGTIKENIIMGWAGDVADLTDEMIEAAARKANIHDFIMSLPNGYDTISGYGSSTLLSGGQKQRVAIARALISDPRILILDESTAALDSDSERIVQAALDEAAKGRTTVTIAHRLSTIQKADVIYVFEGGKIAEQGTHQELLALRGRYAELVNLQGLES